MFNLQSGLHRQSFPAKATPAQRASFKTSSRTDIAHASDFHVDRKVYGPGEGKHKGSVTGIMVDSVNRVVTSCGLDCKMKVRVVMNESCYGVLTVYPVLEFRDWHSHV